MGVQNVDHILYLGRYLLVSPKRSEITWQQFVITLSIYLNRHEEESLKGSEYFSISAYLLFQALKSVSICRGDSSCYHIIHDISHIK